MVCHAPHRCTLEEPHAHQLLFTNPLFGGTSPVLLPVGLVAGHTGVGDGLEGGPRGRDVLFLSGLHDGGAAFAQVLGGPGPHLSGQRPSSIRRWPISFRQEAWHAAVSQPLSSVGPSLSNFAKAGAVRLVDAAHEVRTCHPGRTRLTVQISERSHNSTVRAEGYWFGETKHPWQCIEKSWRRFERHFPSRSPIVFTTPTLSTRSCGPWTR